MTKGLANVRGIEMAYDDVGRGAAVVLLHGFPFDRSMWREQSQALSSTCRVVAPDLRGQGETSLGGVDVTMGEMGEYVAFEFFRRFPERVRALVLADTRPQADTDEARHTREGNAQRVLRDGMASLVDSMLPKLLSAATRESKPDVVERVRTMMLGIVPEGAAAALRA